MTVVTSFVQAVSHGGLMTRPTLIVVHDAETPLKAGYARSIAQNWFGKSAPTSAHFMVDPAETIRLLSDNVIAWAVGPNANGFTLSIEQAGYASFSRAQWTTSEGRLQIARVGLLIRELAGAHGIPLRWATDAQIRAAANGVPGGVCYHDDIRRVLGGTTHHDPMPNYPGDLLEQAWGGKTEEDDMANSDEILTLVRECRDRLRGDTSRPYDPIQLIEKLVTDVQYRVRGTHPDMDSLQVIQWMIGQVTAGAPNVDAGQLAASIAGAIPANIAAQVADELTKRLAS